MDLKLVHWRILLHTSLVALLDSVSCGVGVENSGATIG